MRPLLELHARSLQLRHLGERLHALPVGAREMGIAPPQAAEPQPGASESLQTAAAPPSLAAAHLRARLHRRPPHQDVGRRAHIPLGGAIPVIDHVLRISHWTNEGAAFSLFADSASPSTVRWALIASSLRGRTGVLVALIRMGNRITLTTVALALILGGALGNVHDRIAYGSVVDFIEVHIFTYHWPDFNVADSSIVTGACLLFLDSLLPRPKISSLRTLPRSGAQLRSAAVHCPDCFQLVGQRVPQETQYASGR